VLPRPQQSRRSGHVGQIEISALCMDGCGIIGLWVQVTNTLLRESVAVYLTTRGSTVDTGSDGIRMCMNSDRSDAYVRCEPLFSDLLFSIVLLHQLLSVKT
jgi:hypothetical protein